MREHVHVALGFPRDQEPQFALKVSIIVSCGLVVASQVRAGAGCARCLSECWGAFCCEDEWDKAEREGNESAYSPVMDVLFDPNEAVCVGKYMVKLFSTLFFICLVMCLRDRCWTRYFRRYSHNCIATSVLKPSKLRLVGLAMTTLVQVMPIEHA